MNIVIAMTEEEMNEAILDLIESLERKDPMNSSLLKEVMRRYRDLKESLELCMEEN